MKKKGQDWLLGLFLITVVIALGMTYLGNLSCPASCDDGNPCTLDSCGAETQNTCAHTGIEGEVGACSGEEQGCLQKQCSAGACVENKVRACEYSISCETPTLMSPPYEYYKLGKGGYSFPCEITNMDNVSGRITLSAQLEGYSSPFEKTIVLAPNETQEVGIGLIFNDGFYQIEESRFAVMKVSAKCSNYSVYEDSQNVQIGKASIYSPPGGEEDLIAVWVTYNDPCIEEFISEAKKFAPDGEFRAYQRDNEGIMEELAAVFYALRYQNISYVSSTFSTTDPGGTFYNQDVRLPYQSLKYKQMNCIDGAVLYAAILEKLEYETAVALSPGHAFVLVRSKNSGWGGAFFGSFFSGAGNDWIAIETTDTGDESISFEEAVKKGGRNLENGADIINVHAAFENGVVPLPVGSHGCNIADLTVQAQEYQENPPN